MGAVLQAQTAAPAGPGSGPGTSGRQDALREVAQEFEAIFLAQVLAHLNPAPAGDGPGGSADHGLFHTMFNEEIAKLISRSGGVGVADAVLKEMLKLQEVA
jgi:Rod binding domain-containing protein